VQNTLYYDTWWVGQHVGLVWISTFFLFAVHYLPAKYLDVFHRSALHLGRWVKVEGRHAHVPYTAFVFVAYFYCFAVLVLFVWTVFWSTVCI